MTAKEKAKKQPKKNVLLLIATSRSCLNDQFLCKLIDKTTSSKFLCLEKNYANRKD